MCFGHRHRNQFCVYFSFFYKLSVVWKIKNQHTRCITQWVELFSNISIKDFLTPSFSPRLFNNESFNPGLFNHGFFNHGVEKFMVEKSWVGKSGVLMSSFYKVKGHFNPDFFNPTVFNHELFNPLDHLFCNHFSRKL